MKLLFLTSTDLVLFVSFTTQHWEVALREAILRFNRAQMLSSTKKDGSEERLLSDLRHLNGEDGRSHPIRDSPV